MPAPTTEPSVPYRGLVNFRDAGGHPTRDGRMMRTGALFRSGRLELAEPDDADQLVNTLGIRTVIDLRTRGERHEVGTADLYGWHPGLSEHHLPYFSVLHPAPRDPTVATRSWTPAHVAERYVAMTVARGRFALARIIEVLAAPRGTPALIHCWSGKDRTGLAAAVIQSLVGVVDAAVGEDYAATGVWFARHLDQHPDLQVAPSRAAYAPSAATIRLTLEGLRARFGSLERMLLDSGATPRSITWVRHDLVP